MTRRLILHIGFDKAGSSAIQRAFFGYDDGSTAYMDLFHANHSYEVWSLFLDRETMNRVGRDQLQSRETQQRLAASARERMLAQLALGRDTLILSGEGLSAALRAKDIDRLLNFFRPHVEEIKVIVYLREPKAYRRSGLQERLKRGRCTIAKAPFADYRRRLEPWEAAVGRDAIDFVLFSPATLAGQDVVSDFAARVGLAPGVVTSTRVNESMSAEAFALLYALRKGPAYSGVLWPSVRMNAIARQIKNLGTHRFALADTAFPGWTKSQLADIAWAEARLGRPFVPEPLRSDAVVFGSEADVLAYAEANRTESLKWAREAMPFWATVKACVRAIRERR